MSHQPLAGPALSPGEREVERVLAGLTPAGVGISRDQLLFDAGRASAPRPRKTWPWQVGCAVLAVVAAWGMLRTGAERTGVVQGPKTAPAVSAVPTGSMEPFPEGASLRIRNEWLAHGVLPPRRPAERNGAAAAISAAAE